MILIKNPAGCNQVLNFITDFEDPFVFVTCLNDRAQDGKDVSWIWDVDFERLTLMGDTLRHLYVSGIRADDMAHAVFVRWNAKRENHRGQGLRRAFGHLRPAGGPRILYAHLYSHAGAENPHQQGLWRQEFLGIGEARWN